MEAKKTVKPGLGLLILEHAKKLKPSPSSLSSRDEEEEDSQESEETDENRLGLEESMETFIEAVHSKDTKAAVDAFLELMDLC